MARWFNETQLTSSRIGGKRSPRPVLKRRVNYIPSPRRPSLRKSSPWKFNIGWMSKTVEPTRTERDIADRRPSSLRERCTKRLARAFGFRSRRGCPVVPALPPPADWEELSLTTESDSDFCTSEPGGSPTRRKVRFLLPSCETLLSDNESDDEDNSIWEEPAWCDFM